jgi:hypothetical protein
LSVTETINNYLDHELAGDLTNVLCTGEARRMLDALPNPWPEDAPKPVEESKPVGDVSWLLKGGSLVVGGAGAIPTADHDTLLAGVRGHWRRPLALQRGDLERTFSMRARAKTTVEDILALLRAGHWPTKDAMARDYGKSHSWTGSVMWFCIREKLVKDTGTWDAIFPAAKPKRKRGV